MNLLKTAMTGPTITVWRGFNLGQWFLNMMVRFRDSCTFEPFRDLSVHSFLKNQILVWTPFALGYFNYDTTISGYWHSFEREMLAANISTKSLVATNALLENSNGLSRRWIHYSSQSKGFGLLSMQLSFLDQHCDRKRFMLPASLVWIQF